MRFTNQHVQPEGVYHLLSLVRSPFDRQPLTLHRQDFLGLFNPFPRNLRQVVLQPKPEFPFTGWCQHGRKFYFKKLFRIFSKVSFFSGYFEENESWWLFASHISFRQHEFHRQSWICEEVRQWRLERSSGQILLKSRAKNFID